MLSLTGIFKSILLVVAAVLFWGTLITPLQMFGYSVALVGIFFYNVPLETVQEFMTEMRKGIVSISPSSSS